MGAPRRKFIDGPFGQVHVRISKAEQDRGHLPLICLHQSPKSSREFLKFMSAASKDRTVIAIDNPGHGESDVPASHAEATLENYAVSAWATIDALGYEKVDLFGNHTGSKVACEMAVQRGPSVNKIVMISALVLTEEEIQQFENMFKPIPLDKEGTRFTEAWAKIVEHSDKGYSLVDMASSFAENFRAGEAYEWGHDAAFAYSRVFSERISSLSHRITILNPGDMLFELTPRVKPLLQNGEIINYPDWGFGFLDAYTEGAVEAVKNALA